MPLLSMTGIMVSLPVPDERNSPVACGSPMVAERPILLGFTPASLESLSIRQSVCPPRSARSRECTSSITMKRRSPNRRAISACLRSSMASKDSGVICRMPDGFFKSLFLCDWATSPCQCQTGMCASRHRSFRRMNWSFISAFKGPI